MNNIIANYISPTARLMTIQEKPRKYPFRPTVRSSDSTSPSALPLASEQMASKIDKDLDDTNCKYVPSSWKA